jgi:glutamate/tyrosine decarboxylase-like PLP-dependent enzyme
MECFVSSPAETAIDTSLFAETESLMRRYLEREASEDVTVSLSPEEAARVTEIDLPREGVGEARALERLRAVLDVTPPTAGPRFVNQLFAGRERVATIAELAAVGLNTSMYTFKAAGVQTLIERACIERMLEKAAMCGGDGMFTPGGSLSNLAAMIVGRNEVVDGAGDLGFDGRKRVIYVSGEGHYSINKNASMIGVGRENVRGVGADSEGRMRPELLADAIAADRARGLEPMMVIATSGTTVMGAFDPLEDLAAVAESEGLWLHADGAFGGTALMHHETRHLLDGLERCDSFTWDAHKAMGVPLTCSVALTKKPGLMRKHFDETASYLFQQDLEDEEAGWLNPGLRSLQCGRRNDALKLWAQWQCLGDRGYARRVERQLELARTAAEIARQTPGVRLAHEPRWLTVCFEIEGKSSEAICETLTRKGVLKVGYGVVHGRKVVRLVTVNPEHTPADIERMMNDILDVGERAPAGDNTV